MLHRACTAAVALAVSQNLQGHVIHGHLACLAAHVTGHCMMNEVQ